MCSFTYQDEDILIHIGVDLIYYHWSGDKVLMIIVTVTCLLLMKPAS